MIVRGQSFLGRAWKKNREEIRALLAGHMPRYLVGFSKQARFAVRGTPVLVFHVVEPEAFETQLEFLAENRYRTVDADELERRCLEGAGNSRSVALTFDDADSSFWTYAFPLLKRYGFKAILFAVSGLVPDDAEVRPNLDDVSNGLASLDELRSRAAKQPLCTWRELEEMHASGRIDIQSHSHSHCRVPVSPLVIDFHHPAFDTNPVFPADVPLSVFDDPDRPARRLLPGAPIFENAPRLTGRRRFREDPAFVEALIGCASQCGDSRFFERPDWRAQLSRELSKWPLNRRGEFETTAETTAGMRREFEQSKLELEAQLPGKRVRHFCFPWYQWCPEAVALAAEAGYTSLWGGLNLRHGKRWGPNGPVMMQRIPQEYLRCLPGKGRVAASDVWKARIKGLHRAAV
ncbi:MAG TPA: polysaccharide deacetylase family protein [Gammaproteobacteria bacterium]|nr:polysaccharide deacetylase family protein [Gammaproteobacteria bacterium]